MRAGCCAPRTGKDEGVRETAALAAPRVQPCRADKKAAARATRRRRASSDGGERGVKSSPTAALRRNRLGVARDARHGHQACKARSPTTTSSSLEEGDFAHAAAASLKNGAAAAELRWLRRAPARDLRACVVAERRGDAWLYETSSRLSAPRSTRAAGRWAEYPDGRRRRRSRRRRKRNRRRGPTTRTGRCSRVAAWADAAVAARRRPRDARARRRGAAAQVAAVDDGAGGERRRRRRVAPPRPRRPRRGRRRCAVES